MVGIAVRALDLSCDDREVVRSVPSFAQARADRRCARPRWWYDVAYVTVDMELAVALSDAYRTAVGRGQQFVNGNDVVAECLSRLPASDTAFHRIADAIDFGAIPTTRAGGTSSNPDVSIDHEVACVLRLAAWRATGVRDADVIRAGGHAQTRWAATTVDLLMDAFSATHDAGLTFVNPARLVRACCNGDSATSRRIAANLDQGGLVAAEGKPPTFLVQRLLAFGYGNDVLSRWVLGWRARRAFGLHRRNGPIVNVITQEAVNQCVRLGDPAVALVHLLLGILSLGEQVCVARDVLRTDLLPNDKCWRIFRRYGLSYPNAAMATAGRTVSRASSSGRKIVGDRPASWYPPWTDIALIVAGSAAEVAEEIGHAVVGADRVVIGVLSRSDETIEELLDRCGVSLMDVETELENEMGFV